MSNWGIFLIDKQSNKKYNRQKILDIAGMYKINLCTTEAKINDEVYVVLDNPYGIGLGGYLGSLHIPRELKFQENSDLMTSEILEAVKSVEDSLDYKINRKHLVDKINYNKTSPLESLREFTEYERLIYCAIKFKKKEFLQFMRNLHFKKENSHFTQLKAFYYEVLEFCSLISAIRFEARGEQHNIKVIDRVEIKIEDFKLEDYLYLPQKVILSITK